MPHGWLDLHYIVSMVGRSIASISNLSEHIYLRTSCLSSRLYISAMDLPTIRYVLLIQRHFGAYVHMDFVGTHRQVHK